MQGDGLTAEVLVPSDRARDLLGSDQDHEDRRGALRNDDRAHAAWTILLSITNYYARPRQHGQRRNVRAFAAAETWCAPGRCRIPRSRKNALWCARSVPVSARDGPMRTNVDQRPTAR